MSRTREKRSFTLSSNAMMVLAEFQTECNAASLSAALEKLVQAHQERRKLAALDASIAGYYDGLTGAEATEQQEWGVFATAQSQRLRTRTAARWRLSPPRGGRNLVRSTTCRSPR